MLENTAVVVLICVEINLLEHATAVAVHAVCLRLLTVASVALFLFVVLLHLLHIQNVCVEIYVYSVIPFFCLKVPDPP